MKVSRKSPQCFGCSTQFLCAKDKGASCSVCERGDQAPSLPAIPAPEPEPHVPIECMIHCLVPVGSTTLYTIHGPPPPWPTAGPLDATPCTEVCPIAAWAHKEALPPPTSPDHLLLGTRAGQISLVVRGRWGGFALSDGSQDGGQLLRWNQVPPPLPGALAPSFNDPSILLQANLAVHNPLAEGQLYCPCEQVCVSCA